MPWTLAWFWFSYNEGPTPFCPTKKNRRRPFYLSEWSPGRSRHLPSPEGPTPAGPRSPAWHPSPGAAPSAGPQSPCHRPAPRYPRKRGEKSENHSLFDMFCAVDKDKDSKLLFKCRSGSSFKKSCKKWLVPYEKFSVVEKSIWSISIYLILKNKTT